MVSNVYIEMATGEPRHTLEASAYREERARSGRSGRGSLVSEGTFALRRALWLARSVSPARDWPEGLGWERGGDYPSSFRSTTPRRRRAGRGSTSQ
jgi:hypothetical protein